MYLVRLIYVSQTTELFRPDQIEHILVSARKLNARNEVTGALFYSQKYFIQCLEGSRAAVNETYNRITNDDRHETVSLLQYQEIDRREFSEWSMAYVPESGQFAIQIKAYSRSTLFDPFNMSPESAHQLLLTLREKIK